MFFPPHKWGPGRWATTLFWTLLPLACVLGNKGVEYHPEEEQTTEVPVTVHTGADSQVTTITLVGASGGWLLLPVALFLWSRKRICLSALDRVMDVVESSPDPVNEPYCAATVFRIKKEIRRRSYGGMGDPAFDNPELLIQSRLKKINGSKKKG